MWVGQHKGDGVLLVARSRFSDSRQRRTSSSINPLEIHYTPKHGSWLNMAEIELSVLSRPCLDRQIPNLETLTREVAAWEHARNANTKAINWRFTTPDARIKLKRLYLSIQDG
jgi:hypothetical protein